MNLQQLRYFTTLAEVGHFGRAAERLFITQPVLSNSVRTLERELNQCLFDRSGKQVTLTPYGARFLVHITRALGEIDRAVALSPSPQLDRPRIRAATVASVQQAFLPALLMDYNESLASKGEPAPIGFDILEARTTFESMRMLEDEELDLAFCGFLPKSGLNWVPVLPQRLVVAVSPLNPLSSQDSVSLHDLFDYPLISYRASSMLYGSVKAVLDALHLTFQQAFNEENGAAPYIAANPQCVAVLLDTTEGVTRSRIRLIPIKELDQPFHVVGLTYRQSSLQNADVAQFVEYVEQRYDGLGKLVAMERMLSGY